jgi:hypothetical protein
VKVRAILVRTILTRLLAWAPRNPKPAEPVMVPSEPLPHASTDADSRVMAWRRSGVL